MFHFNRETGATGVCEAKRGKCPFGSLDEHFTSEEAARAAYEKLMEDQTLVKAQKVSNSTSYRALSEADMQHYDGLINSLAEPEVYIHPQGKVFIYDKLTSVARVYKDGKPASTGGKIEDMRSGRGAWKPVDLTSFVAHAAGADTERKRLLAASNLPLNSNLDPSRSDEFTERGITHYSRYERAAILPIAESLNPHKADIEKHAVVDYWGRVDRATNAIIEWPKFEVWKNQSGKYRLVTGSSMTIPTLGSTQHFAHDQTQRPMWNDEKATLVGAFVAKPGGPMIGDVPNISMPCATYK